MEGFRWDDLVRWKAGKLLEPHFIGMYFPSLGELTWMETVHLI